MRPHAALFVCVPRRPHHLTPPHLHLLPHTARLENHVSECFARELHEVVARPEFHALVAASAATIQERQATDSIPLLDDVRYAIMRLYTLDKAALEERFALLDEVLARLDLGVARED